MSDADVAVLIIGGGPCGLAASLTLSRMGVPHLLAERHAAPLRHPKAVGIMQRTAELLRGWGAEAEIRARGVPPDFHRQMVWTTTLAGEELGRTLTPDPDADAAERPSPSSPLRCPQHVTEQVLRGRAGEHDAADLRYEQHVAAVSQDAHGVTATVIDRASGRRNEVRARWVIAADGNGSGVRTALGIRRMGQEDMGQFVNVFFRAPLGPLVADRRAWAYGIATPELVGSLVTLDGANEWILHVNLGPGEAVEDFTAARCVQAVRHAAGVASVDVEVLSVRSWVMGAQLSERFRDGRILLTGDAAHRTTPDGGVGMNTGIASAHNVAWKVGAVAAGWAGEALLATYEQERRAVAERNVAYSAGRGDGLLSMAQAVRAGDLEAVRRAIAARGAIASRQAMDLGYTYESDAILADGSEPPAVDNPARDYVQTARPGSRAPHLWLADGRSTLDLFGRGMVLLAGARGSVWARAAHQQSPGIPLDVHVLGDRLATAPGRFEKLYGITPDGAALVRPDGFVAWRAAGAVDRPAGELRRALDAALGR